MVLQKITGRERVKKAIRCEEVDRVPWVPFVGSHAAYLLGMGAQESIMRAVVADLAPVGKRATAYGYYNTIFGSFWFMGSTALGVLYDVSIPTMITISIGLQLLFVPVFLMFQRDRNG